jgi:hypothetical protein
MFHWPFRRSRPVNSEVPAEPTTDDDTPPAAPTVSRGADVERAQGLVREWIGEQTDHHPMYRDAHDLRIEGIGAEWHSKDDEQHTAYLGELAEWPAKATIASDEAAHAHRLAVEALDNARQEWEQAMLRLGLLLPLRVPTPLDGIPPVPAIGPAPRPLPAGGANPRDAQPGAGRDGLVVDGVIDSNPADYGGGLADDAEGDPIVPPDDRKETST